MPPPRRIPAAGAAFLFGCVAAALCVDFSSYHTRQHADALVPVMVSLYKWEPFYWGQCRLGMLLPALAAPVGDPFWNLMLQNFLGILGSLAAMGGLAWYLLRDRTWAPAGTLAGLGFLVVYPHGERFHLMNGSQPYPIPLAFAVVAIALVAGRGRAALRWMAALALTVLAYWYHFGIGPQIALLAGGRFLYQRLFDPDAPTPAAAGFVRRVWNSRGVREFAFATVLTAFGTAAGIALMALSPHPQEGLGLAPMELWGTGWRKLALGLADRTGGMRYGLAVAAALGLLWLALPATRRAAARAWGVFALGLGWLAFQVLMAGMLEWVHANACDIRYLLPGVIGLLPAMAVLAAVPPMAVTPRDIRPVTAALAALLPVAAVTEYGWPSERAARAAVADAAGKHTADLLDADCTHVVGGYWQVWPATFHANMTLADRGDPRILWPVTLRGQDAAGHWQDQDPHAFRLGGVGPVDAHRSDWEWAFDELEEVGRHGGIVLYRAK